MLGTLAIGAAALAGCPVFPGDNHWNLRVDRLPVLPSSDAIVRSIGAGEHMHADFGSGRYQGARRFERRSKIVPEPACQRLPPSTRWASNSSKRRQRECCTTITCRSPSDARPPSIGARGGSG